jgi:DNA polymerase I
VEAWYRDRPEVKRWQEEQHALVKKRGWVTTLLGRQRQLPEASSPSSSNAARAHALRAAINTPIQGGAADIAMLAMLELDKCATLKRLGWRLLMQVHDEVILEGPAESSQEALAAVRLAMQQPFRGRNLLRCTLEVSSSIAASWYEGK